MKKLMLSVLALWSITTIAQENEKEKFTIPKKSWTFEGELGFNTGNYDNQSTDYINQRDISFNIRPKIGYAVTDNLVIGLGSSYRYGESHSDTNLTNSKTSSNAFEIYPYVKKYFPISKRFAFHLQGETGYGYSKYNASSNNTYSNGRKNEDFFIRVRPGMDFKLTSKIFLHANIGNLGYSRHNSKGLNTNNSEQQNYRGEKLNLNLNSNNFLLGVHLVF